MSRVILSTPVITPRRHRLAGTGYRFDTLLLGSLIVLLAVGLVMTGSASTSIAERQTGEPFYYLWRQALFVGIGLLAGWAVLRTRLVYWEKAGPVLLVASFLLLIIVLVPGVGRAVNGASRWLPLGVFNLQASEPAKLFAIVFIAGYLVRHREAIRSHVLEFLKPVGVVGALAVLLLLEPDFGAAVVILATVLGMMFLARVRFWHFGMLLLLFSATFVALAVSSPYRLERLTTFINPWADPFASGFQLTQALIAFGRGEWFGVGLGASIQKMSYLPEAHTDFLFAVLAEELGLFASLIVIVLFGIVLWRAFVVGSRARKAGNHFAGYLAYGIGLWIGLQAFINIGVNMGVLPTKGLTLPLMSYGGSSIIITCIACALLLRADHETRSPVERERTARAPRQELRQEPYFRPQDERPRWRDTRFSATRRKGRAW